MIAPAVLVKLTRDGKHFSPDDFSAPRPPPALLGEDWIFTAQIKTGRGGECADIAFGSEALRPGHRTRESDHAFPARRVQSESIQAASCNLGRRKRNDPQLGIPSHLVHPVRVHGGDPRFSLRILADFASCSLSYLLPIHQALLRNNKLYVAFIFTGALVGERLVHNTTGALWEMNNQGVSRRPHPGPAPADPSLLTTELCISLSLSLHIARA